MLLDISRTVARSRLPAPTGVDRVERAYIRWALARGGRFLAVVDGRQHLLEREGVCELLRLIDRSGSRFALDLRGRLQILRNRNLRSAQSLVRRVSVASCETNGLAAMLRRHMPDGGPYLNVGHDNLSSQGIASIHRAGLRSAVMIHDTNPLDHPSYARRGSIGKFRTKLTGALAADILIANSQHTASRLKAFGAGKITVAPLGIEQRSPVPTAEPQAFATLGTIEPRKNHRMLLRIWQWFWDRMGDRSPRLIIIGRRGWENAEVFRLLDTEPMMGRTVIETGALDDPEVAAYLARAHALLFPSHAEGYGFPLAEALSAGTPVIASGLPAFREVGRGVPEYIAVDDQAGWMRAIRDYATLGSERRNRQIDRLGNWTAPTWDAHFHIVENALETIFVQSGGDR